jgi:glycosyltransferase involved in cell wall biosynthesis
VTPVLSVIIPNRNGAATIDQCLTAVFASRHRDFEVIVVDDCSTDDSVERIQRHPCRLVRLQQHGGAARARNAGAENSRGTILFFLDADCLPTPDTLQLAEERARQHGPATIIGGTYTTIPADPVFFSTFQSVYINYCETKHLGDPDYIATHALVIHAETFRQSGGLPEKFLPILEDVEFSHRLRRQGFKLLMSPDILVRHLFNFTLRRSLANARRKSQYWLCYSLHNHDLLADSGTASLELKGNVAAFAVSGGLLLAAALTRTPAALPLILLVQAVNFLGQRRLLSAFHQAGGPFFTMRAALYYATLYPAAIVVGGLAGLKTFLQQRWP